MLATQRFNRVQLAFGIGHDFLRNVRDAYLLFAYPFLVEVPGYDVRAVETATDRPVSGAERERNLDLLRFASDQAAAWGLHFQLGLWTHGYSWIESPDASHLIEGLTPENHAAYCRDALRLVLQACPGIAGVTLRVHGESGVTEGNEGFWGEVFQGIVGCWRPVELDLHPKGVDRSMIDRAVRTGLRVTISPKYTAEHMGLPGHQLAIRPTEHRPDLAAVGAGDRFVEQLMNRSAFDLRYTRYGYADFLEEDRPYGVFYRIWPGTQRLLLWGDPELAAGYGREGGFAGCQGVEVMEPLSFKGRRGSGLPDGRDAYSDPALRPAGAAWEKYRYTFRLFGRLLYDPHADPECWRRALRSELGPAAGPAEAALASASRILPLITSAHMPSAANNRYWPELYTNVPIVDAERYHPYRDTPEPRRFGTVSPHDPGLFSTIEEHADQLVAGQRDGRYSPLWVATRLDRLAREAADRLIEARQTGADSGTPRYAGSPPTSASRRRSGGSSPPNCGPAWPTRSPAGPARPRGCGRPSRRTERRARPGSTPSSRAGSIATTSRSAASRSCAATGPTGSPRSTTTWPTWRPSSPARVVRPALSAHGVPRRRSRWPSSSMRRRTSATTTPRRPASSAAGRSGSSFTPTPPMRRA
jgi:hypothetical protein